MIFKHDAEHPVESWSPVIEHPNRGLESISGVDGDIADVLRENGIITRGDVRRTKQEELADLDGIGNALDARIIADVDGLEY